MSENDILNAVSKTFNLQTYTPVNTIKNTTQDRLNKNA